MLCYSCIVQLNTAYNFKNVIIETHMYLERLTIESGGGGTGTMTPAASSIMDDDQSSMIYSLQHNHPQPEMPPPPPRSVISLSVSAGSPNSKESSSSTANGSVSETDEFPMLDPGQIKREPVDEEEENRNFVMHSAIQEIMGRYQTCRKRGRSKGGPPSIASEAAAVKVSKSTTTTPKKARNSDCTAINKLTGGSPTKRAMVAVHKTITRSKQQDKAYLNRVLQKRGDSGQKSTRRRPEQSSSDDDEDDEEDDHKHANDNDSISNKIENSLVYDMNNSKVIREIFENLPKNRLRTRRISTL